MKSYDYLVTQADSLGRCAGHGTTAVHFHHSWKESSSFVSCPIARGHVQPCVQLKVGLSQKPVFGDRSTPLGSHVLT